MYHCDYIAFALIIFIGKYTNIQLATLRLFYKQNSRNQFKTKIQFKHPASCTIEYLRMSRQSESLRMQFATKHFCVTI